MPRGVAAAVATCVSPDTTLATTSAFFLAAGGGGGGIAAATAATATAIATAAAPAVTDIKANTEADGNKTSSRSSFERHAWRGRYVWAFGYFADACRCEYDLRLEMPLW